LGVLGGFGLALSFGLGVKGLGGVFSIRFRTSSRGFLSGEPLAIQYPSLHIEPPSDAMLAAIGNFAIYWARMELALDYLMIRCFRDYGGNKSEKESPKNLSRKVTHVRITSNRPENAGWRVKAAALMDRIDALIDRRHRLIHGCHYETLSNDVLRFAQIRHSKDGNHDYCTHSVSRDELETATAAVRALGHDIFKFAIEIIYLNGADADLIEELRALGVERP
jgi:hypothetical protein